MLPQLLHSVIENVGRDTAEVNTANSRNQARGCIPVKKIGCTKRILAISLIEIAHLYQHHAVRVGDLGFIIGCPERRRFLFFMGICANQR